MNYYRHYVGDYLRDTSELSLAEHGAYLLLLNYYYANEQPLPADRRSIYRMARAMDKEEQAAIDRVLVRFFALGEGGYHNARADVELGIASKVIATAKRNGALGGRPKKTKTQTDEETETETETGTTAHPANNHPPTTNHQPPTTILQPPAKSSLPAKAVDNSTRAVAVCVRLRAAGVQVTSQNPLLQAWVTEFAISDAQLDEALERARQHKPAPTPIPARYLDPVIREVCRPPPINGHGKAKGNGAWWASESAITAKGHELGLSARGGESWEQFKGRINEAIEQRKRALP